MNIPHPQHVAKKHKRLGLTLIELTVVILILLTIIGLGVNYSMGLNDWKKAQTASESLRAVYIAQKAYLADNPTTDIANIQPEDLTPYLPNGLTAIPTVEALDGSQKSIDVTTSPPVVGPKDDPYDPSDSPSDSLWDVGMK